MKKIICVIALLLVVVACGNQKKSVLEKEIDVYEAAIQRISAANNLKEFTLIRNEVKEEISAIKAANREELDSIRWDAFLKKPYAVILQDSLMSTLKKYNAHCRSKKQQFKIK